MYRISKTCHGEDRHKELEAKIEKRKLKLLHAAYQNKPEEFNDEPAELLSDIDRDEENMFSDHYVPTKVSKPQALTFSAIKTPPVVSAPKSIASAAVTLDSDNSHDSDDNESEDKSQLSDNDIESLRGADFISEHHDEVEDASPQVVGTKRPLQDAVEESKLKIMKASNGSRQRLKASDFDNITKDLLAISTSIYQLFNCHTGIPFPRHSLLRRC
ncbi:hypothetical protein EDB19DRAFT_1920916 [Suillus lakei]|nr:hypothetical protein EDB19DRAFT_1920916 [Suillus lakei]